MVILSNLAFLIQFFNNVTDMFGADVNSKQSRFTLIYRFLNSGAVYFILKTHNTENTVSKSLYRWIKSLKWLEHEYYDAFGINFDSNSSTQRLLLDYGFKGFPLRQDFPLSGFVELWFDWSQKIISDDQIALLQELAQDEPAYELNFDASLVNEYLVINELSSAQILLEDQKLNLDLNEVEFLFIENIFNDITSSQYNLESINIDFDENLLKKI